MKHLDFIIWFISFPTMLSVTNYIDCLRHKIDNDKPKYKESTETIASLVYLIIWFGIAYALF